MSLALQLKDYRLTTAEILYHLPQDHRVQTYVWQDLDIAPRYPVLRPVPGLTRIEQYSVRVASVGLVKPPSGARAGARLRLH